MTKRKIAWIVTACIVGAILLTVVGCVIAANSKNDKSLPELPLANWQSMIKSDALIKNIVTPGAHDAGTIGLPYFAATQDRDVTMMLCCGTRYFDLRVSYDNGKYRIYHGPSKGITLESVLDDVREFLTVYMSEFVILDFQHFEEENTEAQQGAIALVEEKLNGMLVTNNTSKSDVDFVDELALGEVRGKCLVTWGRQNASIVNKNYVFQRNNDSGDRADSVIHSYYYGSYNKKSSSAYVKEGLPYYIELFKTRANGKGLFVLQGQLTDGLYVFGPRFREAAHTDRMNEYVTNLKNSEDLDVINIIMRDFVTPAKNCRALELNIAKGLVYESSLTTFTMMIADNTK
ncbi:MAG: phosphatidylinositol-specific phospholipase C domain-containing protein [Corallococcus sp.]|nr:phosphatidylinositol-specific phospholipase C domain-containing protein [Bacillota bacterium]MCM1533457.1 phosphatidylinositol-specific phospholipase C domain-containing protein [Corallococcus sp.]